jgi:steroid 5-alpha reductase family enzyme
MGFLNNLAEFSFATVAVTSLCTFLGGVLGIYPMVVLALGLNWAVGLVSASFASERVFDLTGASTYVICAISSLYLSTDELRKDVQIRPLVATVLVCVWALRLGLFLFSRIVKDGHDSRFDAIRDRPLQFINIWCVWVFERKITRNMQSFVAYQRQYDYLMFAHSSPSYL